MRKVFKKVDVKKPKCSSCGHLLEQHTKRGICEAGCKHGLHYTCPCKQGPTGTERRSLAVASPARAA